MSLNAFKSGPDASLEAFLLLRTGEGVIGECNGLLQEVRWEKAPCSPPKHRLDIGKENARDNAGDALAGPCQHLSWGQASAHVAASQSCWTICFAIGSDSSHSSLHYKTHPFIVEAFNDKPAAPQGLLPLPPGFLPQWLL